ncbi:Serine/threonine-protein phosphatase 7 long form homolog, partial [Linum perenne]
LEDTLIERWRLQTSTFHLPFGECTITLEDIAYITGLPIEGLVVTRPISSRWGEIFMSLLDCLQLDTALDTLKNTWLKENFSWLQHSQAGRSCFHIITIRTVHA